jgi:hypothetical protein
MKFLENVRRGITKQQATKSESRALVPVPQRQHEIVPLRKSDLAAQKAELLEPRRQSQLDNFGAINAELFRFEMWCSITGKPFVAVAEIHGKNLFVIANEEATHRATTFEPGYQMYSVEVSPDWACLWCGTREGHQDFLGSIWECTEPACGHVLHCAGSKRNRFRCACGQIAPRVFGRSGLFHVYIYDGVRGPDGRGRVNMVQNYDGSYSYKSFRGASNGSLVSSNKWLRKLPK